MNYLLIGSGLVALVWLIAASLRDGIAAPRDLGTLTVEHDAAPSAPPAPSCAFCFDGGRCGCQRCRLLHVKRAPDGTPTGGFVSTTGPCGHCGRMS